MFVSGTSLACEQISETNWSYAPRHPAAADVRRNQNPRTGARHADTTPAEQSEPCHETRACPRHLCSRLDACVCTAATGRCTATHTEAETCTGSESNPNHKQQ